MTERLTKYLRDLNTLIPNKVMNTILRDIIEYVLDINAVDKDVFKDVVERIDGDIKELDDKIEELDDLEDSVNEIEKRLDMIDNT